MNRTATPPAWKVALNANTASLRNVAERLRAEKDDAQRLVIVADADRLLEARLKLTK